MCERVRARVRQGALQGCECVRARTLMLEIALFYGSKEAYTSVNRGLY